MDRVDHQLHVEHHLFQNASSRRSIATGSVVVAVVVVAVQLCSYSLSLSPNLGSVLFFRGCILVGVNGLKNNYS